MIVRIHKLLTMLVFQAYNHSEELLAVNALKVHLQQPVAVLLKQVSASNIPVTAQDPTPMLTYKLEVRWLPAESKDPYRSQDTMDMLAALILCISVKLKEKLIAQETVWEEDIAQIINVYATKGTQELIAVYTSKNTSQQ